MVEKQWDESISKGGGTQHTMPLYLCPCPLHDTATLVHSCSDEYSHALSKRLLTNKSDSKDSEKSFLSELKAKQVRAV